MPDDEDRRAGGVRQLDGSRADESGVAGGAALLGMRLQARRGRQAQRGENPRGAPADPDGPGQPRQTGKERPESSSSSIARAFLA